MSSLKNLLGKKFNRLTVVSRDGSKDNRATWLCLCDCGKTCVVSTDKLKSNNTKSCGCLKDEKLKIFFARGFEATEGKKFNYVTANFYDKGAAKWNCTCDCGNTFNANLQDLKTGDTKSCGCLRKMKVKFNLERDLKFLGKKDISELRYGDKRENGNVFISIRPFSGNPIWVGYEKFVLSDINKKLRSVVSGALNRGYATKNDRSEYLLCAPIPFVRKYIEDQFTKDMSWENHGFDTWHFDHIIAMAYAKTQEDKQEAAEILCHYSNLRPLPGPENLEKSDKLPPDADEQFAILKEKVLKYRAENPKPADSK